MIRKVKKLKKQFTKQLNKMDKRQIESYLKKKGMNPKDRVQKNGGGQYLDNFLIEFAQDIKEKTINDSVTLLKRMRY